jgi:hypothetical protein
MRGRAITLRRRRAIGWQPGEVWKLRGVGYVGWKEHDEVA